MNDPTRVRSRLSAARIAGRAALAAAAIGLAGAAAASTTYTLSDDTMSGIFGKVSASGTLTVDPGGTNTYSFTVDEGPYTYTFDNATGVTQPSQQPPTPCVTLGCSAGESFPPGPATFELDGDMAGPVGTSFEDNGEIFTGEGILTVSGSPGPSSSAPEPAAWALMLAGLGVMGGALRARGRAAPGVVG
jgi:hypothetical protein